MAGALYRIKQFLSATRAAPLSPAEIQRVRAVLNDEQFALYQTMPFGDQRHSLGILDALTAQGDTALPLLQAALLHDVAKRDVGLGYRTSVILLNKISPRALTRVASPAPQSWRHPFYLSLHHPELGAQLAAQVGAHESALALIRAHQAQSISPDGESSQLQAWHHALKQWDDVN